MILPKNLSLLALVALSAPLLAQDLPKPKGLSLERLYRYPLVNGRSPSAPSLSPDGSKIVFGWNETGERKLDVWMMDYPSGAKRKIIDASKIEPLPRQDDTRTQLEKDEEQLYDAGIAGFSWAPDSQEFLFSYKGRHWISDPQGKSIRPLFDTTWGISSASFSPDGRSIGFLSSGNLFRMERSGSGIRQLTFISKSNTSIGGYTWSPDGRHIAVTWADNSKLGSHVMMDFSKDRASVVNIRRMWHGEQSVDQQIGIVPATGGLVRWVGGLPRYMWSKSLEWSPDGQFLAIGWIKDDFQEYTISLVRADAERAYPIYQEKAPKNYIPDWRPLVWTRDGSAILFGTDIHEGKFGFRSVMRVSANGRQVSKVYAESHDVVALARPRDSDRLLLTTMSRSPLVTEITIVEPDGRRQVVVPIENGFATGKNFDDAAPPMASWDGKRIVTMASSRTQPTELYGVLPEVRRLTVSQRPEFKQIEWADHTPVSFKAPDGQTVHGVLITRPGLDKTKKHPAFISSMYANSGKLAWNGYFENYAAMELDMVVLQVDFRASWGQGGEFNSGYYKSMGIVDADEAVAAKDFLVSLGYVRPDRVGVWGWSYGGYLTCMIMLTKPEVFHAGVAVASVTDWKSYNEWYTRRRLGMEKDDPEIYKKTSPVHNVDKLTGNLLLVHGMLDDNVLFQDTARLMQQLIDKGQQFDLMLYPRDDHGIGKDPSRPHVFVSTMRYLWSKLSQP
ncbi:MAG TPA: prolyl oligopeptidase family serine peptidase [Fimbriimonadaceae bacterium]|nr:prolyl oligopeptidase family serine peptidase [Fimbriimonadaceae bacterium]